MDRTFGSLALAGRVGRHRVDRRRAGRPYGCRPNRSPAPCKALPPKLLSPGQAPRAPLRLDLTGIAHHTQGGREVERFVTRAQSPDGTWHSTIVIRKISEAIQGGEIVHGQVALVAKIRFSWPRTKTTPPGKGGSFTLKGHTDAVSGGLLGGSAGNDRLPLEPVGVGATWRVVDCDSIDFAPAKEVRTYTLRSIAGGKLVATFRDVVSMDLGNREVGSQKVGDRVVHFRPRQPERDGHGHRADGPRTRADGLRDAGDTCASSRSTRSRRPLRRSRRSRCSSTRGRTRPRADHGAGGASSARRTADAACSAVWAAVSVYHVPR